jgi:hypothetical protein
MVRVELGVPCPSATQLQQVNSWLAQIERIIRGRIRDLDELVADGRLDRAVLADVETSAVARKARNPDGLRQTSSTVTADDVSETVSQTVDVASSDGVLRLTDEEWARLLPASSGGAFTIHPYGAARSTGADPWRS